MAQVTSLGIVAGPSLSLMRSRYAAQLKEAEQKGVTPTGLQQINSTRGILLQTMAGNTDGTTRPSHGAKLQASRDLTFGGGTVSGPSEILLLTGLVVTGGLIIGGGAYLGGRFMKRARS